MGQLMSFLTPPSKQTREGTVSEVAELLANARSVCVLTGAGVSQESGAHRCAELLLRGLLAPAPALNRDNMRCPRAQGSPRSETPETGAQRPCQRT